MFLQRFNKVGMDSSPYYQSQTFNHAKGTTNDLPNCTQFCVSRTYESCEAEKPFVMFNGKSAGGYYMAKQWYDKTILPKGTELKTGSIAVFDGNYGHVAFVEQKIDDTHALISQSQYDEDKSLRNYKYYESKEVELVVGKATLSGIGKLIGFIYLPIRDIRTEENPSKDQIVVFEDLLNVRKEPEGECCEPGCYCPMGIYDVLEVKNLNGWDWYRIEENHWVRDGDWLVFEDDDIMELKKENARLKEELSIANGQLDEIRKIVC